MHIIISVEKKTYSREREKILTFGIIFFVETTTNDDEKHCITSVKNPSFLFLRLLYVVTTPKLI